ncbi:MAG: AAA family ATPase [Calditrichaeota bacterium]|nr:AAA family ATPase [Calditrichota bacterium]
MTKKQMDRNIPTTVVTGDVAIQQLEFLKTPDKSRFNNSGNFYNWQAFPTKCFRFLPGGSLLLAKLIQSSTHAKIITPSLENIEKFSSDKILHSFARIQKFPASGTDGIKRSVYRVVQFDGYTGPSQNTPSVLPIEQDDADAKMVIIDDAGQGFREAPDFWPKALRNTKKPFIFLKMAFPLFKGLLWEELLQNHTERLIVMVSAEDVRRSGINISRQLSWEKTAIDFMEQMQNNPKLADIHNCGYFIVRFDTDGAILYSNQPDKRVAKLYYDPKIGEEGFSDVIPGMMNGIGSAFVAGIVSKIMEEGIEKIGEGIHRGLKGARGFLETGFGTDEAAIDYPAARIFQHPSGAFGNFSVVNIPKGDSQKSDIFKSWCILGELSRQALEKAAVNFVKYGHDSNLENIPIGQFRNLRILDRWEIESFNSIKNLIREYLHSPDVHRPLSIAVFGPPGSGKSFSVNEVVESVAHGSVKKLVFNLSQFKSVKDLAAAFHQVRDVNLEGYTPIVFFDEFDSEFNGTLGWLKYFLKPMLDGHFTEGEVDHPLGRAIFVFAGGTCSTFEEFSRMKQSVDTPTDKTHSLNNGMAKQNDSLDLFRLAKGPDFVSRLRGFVNIKGIDSVDKSDRFYIIRRAIMFRFLMKEKASHLFDKEDKLAIDSVLLNAFLKIPAYKHGARSLSALIDMSTLSARKIYEQSCLPTDIQLELHTDSVKFRELMAKYAGDSEKF